MARLCGSWAKARPSWRGRALLLDELLGPKNDKSPIRGDRAFVASAESGAKAGGTGLLWRLPAVEFSTGLVLAHLRGHEVPIDVL